MVVFAGGMNLILIQTILVRELTTLLLGTELIVLLVSIVYFAGLSLGYVAAGHIARRWLVPLGALTLLLHLTLPVWFRLLTAWWLDARAYWLAFLLLPLLTPLLVSAFYSVFLPLFADNGQGRLATLYGIEVTGSACGVVTLVLFSHLGLPVMLAIYAVALLALLVALGLPARWAIALGLAAVAWLVAFPAASDAGNARFYEALHGLPPGTRTLFSGYSAYQKVDVIESADGARYLFLDGLSHFDTSSGGRLNIMMGRIPGWLMLPERALVLGAGAMYTERMVAEFGTQVTTVEIDPLVVDASIAYFPDYHALDRLSGRSIVIDDAKHFLATTDQRYGLIVSDVPAAYAVQTANLYTVAFYELLKSRLSDDGMAVVNLTSAFGPDDLVSRRIVASLLEVYDDVLVLTADSVGWSVAYAADRLPFSRSALEEALRDNGERQYSIFHTDAARIIAGDARPITADSLDIALQVSASWVAERLAWR